jgi:peroxin-11B
MRVGKFLEHFQAALKATAIRDPVVSYTAIGRQLGYGFYLILDMLQWVHGAKVYQFNPETHKAIAKNAARFWLTGLTFSLVSGSYKTYQIRQRLASAQRPRATAEKEAERKLEIQGIKAEEAAVRYQMTQDALDWVIPATGADLLNLDEGILGLAGFASSVMGGKSQWKAVNGGGVAAAKK